MMTQVLLIGSRGKQGQTDRRLDVIEEAMQA